MRGIAIELTLTYHFVKTHHCQCENVCVCGVGRGGVGHKDPLCVISCMNNLEKDVILKRMTLRGQILDFLSHQHKT